MRRGERWMDGWKWSRRERGARAMRGTETVVGTERGNNKKARRNAVKSAERERGSGICSLWSQLAIPSNTQTKAMLRVLHWWRIGTFYGRWIAASIIRHPSRPNRSCHVSSCAPLPSSDFDSLPPLSFLFFSHEPLF